MYNKERVIAQMKSIELYVYPYWGIDQVRTGICIDGKPVRSTKNRLHSFMCVQGMDKWLLPRREGYVIWKGILPELCRQLNDDEFEIMFTGRRYDYERFEEELARQTESLQRKGELSVCTCRFSSRWEIDQTEEELGKVMHSAHELARSLDFYREAMKKSAVTLEHLEKALETVEINSCGSRGVHYEGLTEGGSGPCILLTGIHDSAKEYSEEILKSCMGRNSSDLNDITVLLPEKDNERGYRMMSVIKENCRKQLGISVRLLLTGAADFSDRLMYYARSAAHAPVISQLIKCIYQVVCNMDDWEMDAEAVDIYNSLEALQKNPGISDGEVRGNGAEKRA